MVNWEWCHYCDEPECRRGVFDCESYKRRHPDYKNDPDYKRHIEEKSRARKK